MKKFILPFLALGILVGCSDESATEIDKEKEVSSEEVVADTAKENENKDVETDTITDTEENTSPIAEIEKATKTILEISDDLTTAKPVEVAVEIPEGVESADIVSTLNKAMEMYGVNFEGVSKAVNSDKINLQITESSTTGLSSSAQTGVFMDILTYTMYKNFPEISAYTLSIGSAPAIIGDMGDIGEIKNEKPSNTYLEILE